MFGSTLENIFQDDTDIIYVTSMAIIFITVSQFCCHKSMLMRWYKDNPADGFAVARSISVGLPLDATNDQVTANDPQVGHAVPEADREV